jgi:hypothetical protein
MSTYKGKEETYLIIRSEHDSTRARSQHTMLVTDRLGNIWCMTTTESLAERSRAGKTWDQVRSEDVDLILKPLEHRRTWSRLR